MVSVISSSSLSGAKPEVASAPTAVVSEPYDIDGQHVVIGASVGIAVGPNDGTTPEQIIRNADLALYRAKGDGRGTYRFFEPEMDAQMQARRELESDLRRALPAAEFDLH
jgi:diguanylate cyclase (GGDEF)-like protein